MSENKLQELLKKVGSDPEARKRLRILKSLRTKKAPLRIILRCQSAWG